MEVFIILFFLAIFTLPFIKLAKEVDRRGKRKEYNNKKVKQTEVNYAKSYQRKYLLTKFEYKEFMKLKEAAKKRNFMICPKVRLLDLIEPYHDSPSYMELLHKIQAKHVDFVITDKNLHVKAIIELDDNSHNMPDRIERDIFVDTVLRSTGYTVLHVKRIDSDIFEFMDEIQVTEENKPIIEQTEPNKQP